MIPVWAPRAGGIVPLDPEGTPQEEGRFAGSQRALELARSEYEARHYDEASSILDALLPSLRNLVEDRAVLRRDLYALLFASACVLRARLHWRIGERARARQDEGTAIYEQRRQTEVFQQALDIFREHQAVIVDSRQHTDYGIALARTDNHKEAVERLTKALATGVPPVEAFGYLGMAYSTLGRYADSLRELRKGLQLAPRDRVLLETLARTYEAAKDGPAAARTYCQCAIEAGTEGDVFAARQFLETALRANPGHPQALSMLVELLRSEKKQDEAKQMLDQLLTERPDDPWARGLRGMVRQDLDDKEGALTDFAQVRVGSAALAWVWLEHAKTLADSEPKHAMKLLSEASKLLSSDDPRLRQALSEVAVRAAIAKAGKSANQFTRDVISWLAQSDRLREIGETLAGPEFHRLVSWAREDEAEKLKQAAERLPERAEPREALAKLYATRGKFEAAVTELQEATRLAPDRITTREMLADIYLRSGKLDEAVVVLDEAIRLNPEAPGLFRLRAEASHKLGDESEALRYRLRAVRAAPEDDALLAELVAALMAAGLRDEAIEALDRRLKISPRHASVLARKGNLLVEMSRFEAGIQALSEAEEMLSDAKDLRSVRISIGNAFLAIGKSVEAGAAFDRAITVDNQLGDAYAYKAKLLIETAEYEAAAEMLELLVARLDEREEGHHPRLAWLNAWRGRALYSAQTKALSVVEEVLRATLRFEPSDPYARRDLGQLLLRIPEREKEGRAILEQLTELGERQIPRDLVGWCHFLLGRHVAAEHWLRAALADEPNEPSVNFDLALVLLASGSAQANQAYQDAVKISLKSDAPRQRGILYVALFDLVEAIEVRVIMLSSGILRSRELRERLRAGEFPAERLAPLVRRLELVASSRDALDNSHGRDAPVADV